MINACMGTDLLQSSESVGLANQHQQRNIEIVLFNHKRIHAINQSKWLCFTLRKLFSWAKSVIHCSSTKVEKRKRKAQIPNCTALFLFNLVPQFSTILSFHRYLQKTRTLQCTRWQIAKQPLHFASCQVRKCVCSNSEEKTKTSRTKSLKLNDQKSDATIHWVLFPNCMHLSLFVTFVHTFHSG